MSFIRKYNEDTKVWLMSDLHIGHDRYFVWAKRGFSNVQEHNVKFIENIKIRKRSESWQNFPLPAFLRFVYRLILFFSQLMCSIVHSLINCVNITFV